MINAIASEFDQWRPSRRHDLSLSRIGGNFRDCLTAKGPLLLFSARLIHCPKLVRLRATNNPTPRKSSVASTFSFLILKSFLRARALCTREIAKSLRFCDLSTGSSSMDNRKRRFRGLVKEQRIATGKAIFSARRRNSDRGREARKVGLS